MSGALLATMIAHQGSASEEQGKADHGFPAEALHPNENGALKLLYSGPPIDTRTHAFFKPVGSNGRACVTCHQPASAMALSSASVAERWARAGHRHPLFAPIDGSNCPSLPQAERASHSLLIDRGLFRISMPWPPKRADGSVVKPEFDIAVVSDPTGCNLDPIYGIDGSRREVSVFRRPRMAANLRHVIDATKGIPPNETFLFIDKTLLPQDPDTGEFLADRLMADARVSSLGAQAQSAMTAHLEGASALNTAQLDQIRQFESAIYAAQAQVTRAGPIAPGKAPPGMGPEVLRDGPSAVGTQALLNQVFGTFVMWEAPTQGPTAPRTSTAQFRASVARGARVFNEKKFYARDVGRWGDRGLGNPIKGSCASCHNALLSGLDVSPGIMDIGTSTWPWTQRSDLPLFKLTCHADARAHPYLGRTIYSYDPGRALVTGKCVDASALMTPQMRGLAARAPYFVNGGARTLRELVDFYDRRFSIGYTEREKDDLVNFLGVL